jgi:endo-1,4-beta-xylanase
MKLTKLTFWILVGLTILVQACTSKDSGELGLKDALDGKFFMGAALNSSQIYGDDSASVKLLNQHFNSIVAENCMKSEIIQPEESVFDFRQSDAMVEYGVENDMYIVGHCLVWHSQVPEWLFFDSDRKYVSREVLIERMKTHISTLVGRYKGRVDCWDVVNEAFLDDGSWRKTKFYDIIGPEYIKLAFQFAHEADPDAELLYNDYSMFHEGRRSAVVSLATELKEEGIQIDGIGMQAHYGLDNLPLKKFEESVKAFAKAGLDVHITELDISVLPFPDWNVGAEVSASFEYKQQMNPFSDGISDSARIAAHDAYLDFFKLMLKHQDKIKRVTTWGVADHHSWKNNWPMQGRTDYPLLFDRNNEAKPVVNDIITESELETLLLIKQL